MKKRRLSIFLVFLFSLLSLGIFWLPAKKQPPAPSLSRDFTVIVLPDTQKYSALYPEIFAGQTQWIVENKVKENIVFISHLGDIVDGWDDDQQWQNADQALSLLDGQVPYGFLAGNHDEPDI